MSSLLETPVTQYPLILNLIDQLCQTLDIENIQYCHWKSNAALDRSATGENDLDLLVSRADAQRFSEILAGLGFKKAYPPRVKQMPGILDYYGYDEPSDRWVHVHVHYQLVLGHDQTKNYGLPVEALFFDSIRNQQGFKVPSPEVEFIIFVIRMILKYSTWDVLYNGQGILPETAQNELEYLEDRIDWTQINHYLKEHLPYLDPSLFDDCARSLHPGCTIWTRIRVGHQLQKQLRSFARRPHALDVWLKLWRSASQLAQRRILHRRLKKRLESGGAMIAIVGGDGAGKSTIVAALSTWLSKNFETCVVHLGKPPRSRLTQLLRAVLKVVPFPALGHLCTARDRALTYHHARRFATNGGLVICDRFPLPHLHLMDAPQVGSTHPRLAQLEQHYYQQLVPPDLLIVLKVDPEIAVERKTTEPELHVRSRSTEVWEADWESTGAHIIDASQPCSQVLADLKSLIWRRL